MDQFGFAQHAVALRVGTDLVLSYVTVDDFDRMNFTKISCGFSLQAAPLSKTIDTLSRSNSARETHLASFLGNLAAMLAYQPKAAETRIAIFSDMAENTSEHTFLPGKKPQFDPASFAKYFDETIGGRLAHIVVEINVMPSATTPPAVARRIKAAWTQALTAHGIPFTWRQL